MYAILLAPASNRVYAGESGELVAAELSVLLSAVDRDPGPIRPLELAGVGYLALDLPPDPVVDRELGRASAVLAAYEQVGDLLRPVPIERPDRFDDDLVTIPKYPGKTNEQFTRLLVNVTLAARRAPRLGPASILDPMSGRGTTLSTAWILGHHGYGVESDPKAVEAQAAFLRTYLRRKRIKHRLTTTPVRRDGRSLGRRLDAEVQPPQAGPGGADSTHGGPALELTVFTGDTRDTAFLYGKRTFDAVVTDAPYGIVHGSAHRESGASARAGKHGKASRDRSAADLLAEAIPIWAGLLRPGGALGLSWNTYGLRREDLADIARRAGLEPQDGDPYLRFGHRVDASIHRDVFVAVAPLR
ncbi:TRM11 family SAM-dependent methyltransferase [Microlunatus ginsengisoli]|uniref:SAM-dependent methyltransferase n=1 Tax=Microlunatus ginsengisoli TaxID=363863 RepID=A0ABP6ZGC8_9ACTN